MVFSDGATLMVSAYSSSVSKLKFSISPFSAAVGLFTQTVRSFCAPPANLTCIEIDNFGIISSASRNDSSIITNQFFVKSKFDVSPCAALTFIASPLAAGLGCSHEFGDIPKQASMELIANCSSCVRIGSPSNCALNVGGGIGLPSSVIDLSGTTMMFCEPFRAASVKLFCNPAVEPSAGTNTISCGPLLNMSCFWDLMKFNSFCGFIACVVMACMDFCPSITTTRPSATLYGIREPGHGVRFNTLSFPIKTCSTYGSSTRPGSRIPYKV